MSDHSSRLNWVTVGALALLHAGSLAALFLFTWQALWIAGALLWISGGWGIGTGYHRLLTHRGYETPRWLEYTLSAERADNAVRWCCPSECFFRAAGGFFPPRGHTAGF
jgi:fatty-acid desaturase